MAIIQNYRGDIADKVISLANYSPLQPVRDKNYDVTKLNDRFLKISEAVRIVFESVGSLAAADRAFVPTFLKGYVNPVKNISVTHTNTLDYKFSSGLDASGAPITFPDGRIVYSFPEIFDIATNAYEFLVFKNGYLANTNDYLLSNTSSGVKVFYKDTLVGNNDIITLVVNRIYSPTYNMFKYTHTNAVSSTSYSVTIDVNQYFSYFQSVKYLSVAVRPAGSNNYQLLNKINYSIVYDTYTTQATIALKNYTLNQYDTLLVLDSLTYFNKIINDANTSLIPKTPSDIELTYIHPTTSEKLPIHFENVNEFEMWINGHRLLPETHYVIKTVKVNNVDVNYISFLFTIKPSETYQIYLTKNSVYTNKSYSYSSTLDTKGVELLNMDVNLYENLGYTYVDGQLIDNKNTMTVHDNLLHVKATTNSKNFYYNVFIPNNPIVDGLIDGFKDSLSESEKIIIATGGINNFITNYKTNLTDKTFNSYITPLQLLGGEDTDIYQYLDSYQNIIFNQINNNLLTSSQIMDANTINSDDFSTVANTLNSPIGELLWVVDGNLVRNTNAIFDSNPSTSIIAQAYSDQITILQTIQSNIGINSQVLDANDPSSDIFNTIANEINAVDSSIVFRVDANAVLSENIILNGN